MDAQVTGQFSNSNGEDLKKLLEVTPLAMVLSQADGSFEYLNPACKLMLGYPEQNIYAADVLTCRPEALCINQKIRQQLEAEPLQPIVMEKRYLHRSGKVLPGLLTIAVQLDRNDRVQGYTSHLVDFSHHKKEEHSNALLTKFLEHSNDAIMIVDAQTARIKDCNHIAHTRLGYSKHELLQLRAFEINREDMEETWPEYVKQVQQHGKITREGFHTCKDGSSFPVEDNISYITNGKESYLLAMIRDISHRKAQEQVIWKQANYDPLTNLPNRRLVNDRLQQAILTANRSESHVAVLYLDLDRFKEVNDSLGHTMGDLLLVEASERLLSCTRDSDTLARLGGDEFTLILSDIKHKLDIDKIAGKILSCFKQAFTLDEHQVFISTSIGISIYPDDAKDGQGLIKHADQAMYAVKASGRNDFQYFTTALQRQAQDKAKLATKLHGALKSQEFTLVFQPIQELASGKINKAEALLRWQSESEGEVSPYEFIPVAEETGLITEIGDWVFKQAAQQVLEWRQVFCPDFQISINTTPAQYYRVQSQIDLWLQYLNKLGLDANAVALEIAEDHLAGSKGAVCDKLLSFHSQNADIHLDDFGAGYSSLSNLKRLEVDVIKLDQQLIKQLHEDKNSQILCETLITMSHKLGMKVIAKGVESKQQLAILREYNCDFVQGYWLSPALSAHEFKLWLSTRNHAEVT